MEKVLYLILLFIFSNCSNKSNITIDKIKSSNISLFENVTIEARDFKEGKPRAYFFTKEIKDTKYLLPNITAFDCKIEDSLCFQKYTDKKFNIVAFAKANNIKEQEIYKHTSNYIIDVIREFENIGVHKIMSNELIGSCIIFFLEEKRFIAYVSNKKEVNNKFWQAKFNQKNKLGKNWYYGVY